MTTSCPKCGRKLQVADTAAGHRVRCPECQQVFTAEAPSERPAEPAARPPSAADEVAAAAQESGAKPKAQRVKKKPAGGGFFGGAADGPVSKLSMPGKIAIAVGLMLVIVGRGCDSLSTRNVLRASASATRIQAEFDGEWNPKITEAQEAINNADDAESRNQAREKINELRKEQSEARQDINKELSEARTDAKLAAANAASRAIWFELLFLIGSIALVGGLLITAATAVAWPERIVSLVLLVIIVFSIYIGGVAWLSSTATTIKGLGA